MRRGSPFERLGYFFESVGRWAEPRRAQSEKEYMARHVRSACRLIFGFNLFVALVAIIALVDGGSPWTILVLALNVGTAAAGARAMQTGTARWLLVTFTLLVLTIASTGLT